MGTGQCLIDNQKTCMEDLKTGMHANWLPLGLKNIRVSTNMPKNIRVSRSEIIFIFCLLYADFRAKLLLGA